MLFVYYFWKSIWYYCSDTTNLRTPFAANSFVCAVFFFYHQCSFFACKIADRLSVVVVYSLIFIGSHDVIDRIWEYGREFRMPNKRWGDRERRSQQQCKIEQRIMEIVIQVVINIPNKYFSYIYYRMWRYILWTKFNRLQNFFNTR